MNLEESKTAAKALTELIECQKDLFFAVRGTAQRAAETKKLWRQGNKSRLIKIGMALIVFPDPSPASDIIGACFVAAGAVQKGLQSRNIYMEDIGKTFQGTFKEIVSAKNALPRYRDEL
jgi:hypothetical protein